jgi:hypothetical protein
LELLPVTLEATRNSILVPRGGRDPDDSYRVPTAPAAIDAKLRKRENAGEALGELVHGIERYFVTKGQFSLIDLIRRILDQTGPADVVISTWTSAGADIAEAFDLLDDGRIRSIRFLVDHFFQRRKPQFCGQIRKLFGDESIRVTRNHAKLVVITNDEWKISVLTSMNLNTNPRLEYALVRESPELADFNLRWINAIFDEKKARKQFGEPAEHRSQRGFKTL